MSDGKRLSRGEGRKIGAFNVKPLITGALTAEQVIACCCRVKRRHHLLQFPKFLILIVYLEKADVGRNMYNYSRFWRPRVLSIMKLSSVTPPHYFLTPSDGLSSCTLGITILYLTSSLSRSSGALKIPRFTACKCFLAV